MAVFVSLVNWTDKGIAGFKGSPERAAGVAELAHKHGGRMVTLYWTIGAYDLVAVFDMRDDARFTAMALEIGTLGTIRTTTLRAFNEEEFSQIVAKTG
jgi:uncharacterized protein with GYD domain